MILKRILYLITLSVLSLLATESFATHIRAGDLTAVRISGGSALTYRFTVILYRDTEGVPAQPGTFEFGYTSATPAVIDPVSLGFIDGDTEILIYQVEHTFPSSGTFRVSYFEQNRNPGVRNMFASGNTAFYIESVFRINPAFGLNSSPVLLIPPVDKAAIGQRYIHNPGAYDVDGDSLSYRLTVCKQGKDNNGNAIEVSQYKYPDHPDFNGVKEDGTGVATFTLNPFNGDLIWDAPGELGEYNVAFYVDEWRNGIQIGSVNRDMQIIVVEGNNKRPELMVPMDTCIVAGSTLIDTISARDPDSDYITLTGEGGLFVHPDTGGHANQAQFKVLRLQPPNGYEEGEFTWKSECSDIRRQPYQATFKAVDKPDQNEFKLADLQTWLIRVVGPAPENLVSDVDLVSNTVTLNWDNYPCPNEGAVMTVWRRKGAFDFQPDNCETGLPAYTGYEQIGQIDVNTNTFIDDNKGRGLEKGTTYCYRIFVRFPEPTGGESYASEETCVFIPQLAPYIVEVDVLETDRNNGEIGVRWTTPITIDTVEYPRPYTYTLTRSEGLDGNTNAVDLPTVFNELDTFFVDTGLDTERLPYNYVINLFSQGTLVDTSSSASSVDLMTKPALQSVELSWEANVPWSIGSSDFTTHYVFRADPNNKDNFILIDSVDITEDGFNYVDKGEIPGFPVVEKEEYCYKVLTVGTYDNDFIRDSLLNNSQISCAVVLDTTAPCPPTLTVEKLDCSTIGVKLEDQTADCSVGDTLFSNRLSWEIDPDPNCDQEIVSYNVYYSPRENGELELIATDVLNTNYIHAGLTSVAGCYAVTALDATGNESDFSNLDCNDNCPFYELPNVFTPNEDAFNDLFRPFKCIKFVESVEFTVVNRWGQTVYSQNGDKYINWDGKNNDGEQLSSGVYYYSAKLKTIRLREKDETELVKGWIQIINNNNP
ncbi:T9SS C-terminal target domain-containing protein [Flexithrix dorotheae]|uniref:T9SS C-terminal target domain-containing protein n=1 Tax=Flexithrix dorotheae TaxID=70993 RepID=UPI000380FABD|nr:T9SS C-terminal target domain-containing protein [Flexithrix dorotheae]